MKATYWATVEEGKIKPYNPTVAAVELSKVAGKRVLVTVETETKKRTGRQNDRYWGLIVPAFAQWTGYEEFPESAEMIGKTPKESAHNVLKSMLLQMIDVTLPNGQVVSVNQSTASLTTAQMADLQDRAERFLNQNGIHLPA